MRCLVVVVDWFGICWSFVPWVILDDSSAMIVKLSFVIIKPLVCISPFESFEFFVELDFIDTQLIDLFLFQLE